MWPNGVHLRRFALTQRFFRGISTICWNNRDRLVPGAASCIPKAFPRFVTWPSQSDSAGRRRVRIRQKINGCPLGAMTLLTHVQYWIVWYLASTYWLAFMLVDFVRRKIRTGVACSIVSATYVEPSMGLHASVTERAKRMLRESVKLTVDNVGGDLHTLYGDLGRPYISIRFTNGAGKMCQVMSDGALDISSDKEGVCYRPTCRYRKL
jgi:hypothetical protein